MQASPLSQSLSSSYFSDWLNIYFVNDFTLSALAHLHCMQSLFVYAATSIAEDFWRENEAKPPQIFCRIFFVCLSVE